MNTTATLKNTATSNPKARTKAKAKRERIIIDLTPEALSLIDELEDRTGSHTRAELFRNMLKFVGAYMDELDEGNEPLWEDKDGNTYRAKIHKVLFLT